MKRVLLLVVLVLAVAGWAYVSPRLAAKRFRDATLAGDVSALNAVVDFPALREHLKADLRANVAQRASADLRNNPLGAALGAQAGGAVSDALVERFVSPRGLISLARYGSADPGTSSVQLELLGMGYQDLSDFGVTLGNPRRANQGVTFVFHRSGLSWRLTRLEIPSLTQH
jgi:Protein of unknown function (DUF2939)